MQNSTKNKLILYSLILGFLGFLDATYLTILHYKHIIPPCNLSNGCESVLTSKYAMLGPVPVSLLGAIFYLLVIFVCLLLLTNFRKIFLEAFYYIAAAGLVVSLILLYIQAYVLRSFCQYCLLSELISAGIAILAFLKFKEDKKIDV